MNAEHITTLADTAQTYRNEAEAGQALRESGVPRTEMYITTKYSGLKDLESSIQDSLDNVSPSAKNVLKFKRSFQANWIFRWHSQLGVSYVDLYLIHNPGLAKGDISGLWSQFQRIQARGLAKCIDT